MGLIILFEQLSENFEDRIRIWCEEDFENIVETLDLTDWIHRLSSVFVLRACTDFPRVMQHIVA